MPSRLALASILAVILTASGCGDQPDPVGGEIRTPSSAPGGRESPDPAPLIVPLERVDASVRALASEDPVVRKRAEEELLAAGPDAAPRLLESVSGADPHFLAAAPNVLKAMGPEVVPHLRNALRDGDADRRVVAVMALLLMGRDAAGAADALAAARSDPDPRVRAAAEHAYKRAIGDTSDLDRQRAEHDEALRRSRGQ